MDSKDSQKPTIRMHAYMYYTVKTICDFLLHTLLHFLTLPYLSNEITTRVKDETTTLLVPKNSIAVHPLTPT